MTQHNARKQKKRTSYVKPGTMKHLPLDIVKGSTSLYSGSTYTSYTCITMPSGTYYYVYCYYYCSPKANCYCWVAREVYGVDNPKWLLFRDWLLNQAPAWFRDLYLKHGEQFAAFISNKPLLKSLIRTWMDNRIENHIWTRLKLRCI